MTLGPDVRQDDGLALAGNDQQRPQIPPLTGKGDRERPKAEISAVTVSRHHTGYAQQGEGTR